MDGSPEMSASPGQEKSKHCNSKAPDEQLGNGVRTMVTRSGKIIGNASLQNPNNNLNVDCNVNVPSVNLLQNKSIRYELRNLGDGSTINAKKCCKTRCSEFCPRFLPACRVFSTITGRYIDCKNEDLTREINCNSVNVIYVITCSTCYLQYVGQTACVINHRFCTHRAVMRGEKYSNSCKCLSDHFTKGRCKGSDHFVQIVEQLSGNGRLASGEIDASVTRERKLREDAWMLKLRTVYPYGLNDALNFKPNTAYASCDGINGVVGKLFPPLPRYHSRSFRVHNHNTPTCIPIDFISNIKHWLHTDAGSAAFNIRKSLASMRKCNLKKIAMQLNDILSCVDSDFFYFQWFRMALDIIETKMYKLPKAKKVQTMPKHKMCIPFVNKALEFINLPNILRSKEVMKNTPHLMEVEDIPMVVYSLTDSIRSSIFNYKQFVKHLDFDLFSRDQSTIVCYCKKVDKKFIDNSCNHVLTGDLSIIRNNKLRKLICKGPKYREPEKINWAEAKNIIEAALESFIKNLCEEKGVSEPYFNNWKHTVITKIDSKISHYSPRVKSVQVQKVLDNCNVKKELRELQKFFVLVPIDKAANNIAFICKQHYANVLKTELGYSGRPTRRGSTRTSPTYDLLSGVDAGEIVSQQVMVVEKYGLIVNEEMKSLPSIYWSPKLHKNPIGSRFIIASKLSSIKPLLKDLTCIFKLFQNQVESYNDKSRVWSGVSGYWVIQNSNPVIERINKINSRKKAKTIATFDFATLYTKIPHELLIEALNSIVDFAFKGGLANAVYVNKYGASWRNSAGARVYKICDIKKALKYSIENAYFQAGNLVFRQKIGIPIGSDPAPFFANLFLYAYESKFINHLLKTDPVRAQKFRHVFRFIDDLLSLNDDGEFAKSFCEIYPPEMEIKKENDSDTSASYLELGIAMNDGTAMTKLYDKRDAFNFSVVRLPYKCSNIPLKMFFATIGAEVLRICKATSDYNWFVENVKILLCRMKKQGADGSGIKNVLKKMILRHHGYFAKFSMTMNDIIRDCC